MRQSKPRIADETIKTTSEPRPWNKITKMGPALNHKPISRYNEAKLIQAGLEIEGYETRIKRCGDRGLFFCVKWREAK